MSATTRGAERARLPATDLDRSGYSHPHALKLGKREPCTLHLIPYTGRRTPLNTTEQTIEAIGMARKVAQVPQCDDSAWIDPADLSATPIRGVPWAKFPVVGDPRYTMSTIPGVISFKTRDPIQRSAGLDETVGRTRSLIVHLPEDWDAGPRTCRDATAAWTYKANVVANALGEDLPVLLMAPNGSVVGGRSELSFLAGDIAPWMRFRYSYALNFGAMAYRLLDKALHGPDPEAYAVYKAHRARTRYNAGMITRQLKRTFPLRGGWPPEGTGICSPVALQILYALRRRGGADVHVHPGLSWQERLVDPDGEDGTSWRGSGRYAPRVLDHAEVAGAVNALVDYQLLRFGEASDTVAPSRTGEAFLDLLPAACEDADLLCRWGHPPYPREAMKAMDAWITRTFSKLKRKVDALDHAWDVPPKGDDL